MNEIILTESRAARDEYADRADVLAKVKVLDLLPDDLHVTTEMVAGYFEVGVEAIKSVIKRHRDELIENGLLAVRGGDLATLKAELAGQASEVQAEPHWDRISALALFTRRTVLNVAMLLVDSDVARQVRRALLDRYEEPARPGTEHASLAAVEAELRVLDLARSIGAMTSTETRYHGRVALARVGIVEPPAEPETRAESALRWMERHELGVGDTISLRQIYQGLDGRTWCRRVTDAEDVVHELVQTGYLRKLPRPAPKQGRPPSPRFELVRPPRHLAVVPDGTAGAAS